jgi:hypothetical protein
MKTARDLFGAVQTLQPNATVYVQCGFNRFEINSYVIQKDGSLLLLLEEDANNPVAERVVAPPKELA